VSKSGSFSQAQEGGRANADRAGSLLDIRLGEEGDDRPFFLRSYFAPWPFISNHLTSLGVIAVPSPFSDSVVRLRPGRTGVIHVLTAVITRKENSR